ncbi:MAG: hypothetical protein ABSB97_03115 [Thermoplasmata archaeon]|jgi:hypothetical protein
MSAIFQRPLCDMGAVYEFAFRPIVGEADVGAGGGCDDRPHRVEVFSASVDPRSDSMAWRPFSLCPEHEAQLRRYDERVQGKGLASRFRASAATATGTHAR